MIKLISMNKNIEKYGCPKEVYDRDDFQGDAIGAAIAVCNTITHEIEKNLLPPQIENADNILTDILNDPEIKTIETPIDDLHIMILLPYEVENHTKHLPTVLAPVNKECKITVEILFATDDGANRYLTAEFLTNKVSPAEIIYKIFANAEIDNTNLYGLFENIPEFAYSNKTEEEGYSFDFYNSFGRKYKKNFETPRELLQSIVSIRTIGFEEN